MLFILNILGLVDTKENFLNIQILTQLRLDKIYANDLKENIVKNNQTLVDILANSTNFAEIGEN